MQQHMSHFIRPQRRARPSALWLVLIPAILLSACAVLDPNNIVGRHRSSAAVESGPVSVKDNQWRQAALDEVWSTINDKYYDPTLNGVDWKAVRQRHEAGILAAAGDDEYWERLDRMAGELRDAHTRVLGPKDVAQIRDHESHSLGLGLRELDGTLVVTGVNGESDAWWAGVRAGMIVLTIDGEPAMAKYRRLVEAARESSTPWTRARNAIRKIVSGDLDSRVVMRFNRGAGVEGDDILVEMKRRRFPVPPEQKSRVLPSGFGYLRFSGFDESLQNGIIAAIAGLKDTPGMIVDLRNNGGGSLRMANRLTEQFLAGKARGARVLTRDGKPITVAFIPVIRLETELNGDPETAYRKPIVILTNENSASASEIFTGTLQDLGRATVVGQRTCGCLLGYLGYADLPGGGQLAYSEIGFLLPKGKRIEGEGIMPDVAIMPAREDMVRMRDRALEAAVSILKEKTKG